MSSMMGGDSGSQEDMFAKLDSMRAVITEVNTQFKDPVFPASFALTCAHPYNRKKQHSSAFVYQSSCRFTRQSDWYKS